ncbi:MAG: glucosaminidase domain-containing protein [Bacteroidota bacterium]
MKQILLSVLLLGVCVHLTAQGKEDRLNYIEKYKDIAMEEMNRAGVPASIKLAQGILESNAGRSYLARRANNHFGMKCGSAAQWSGKKIYREDDDYDENGKLRKSCFRVYKNPEASYIAHSEFLRDERKAYRYGFLFRLDAQDYKRWAKGLKQAGYATGANYDRKLISLIETYQLDQYDQQAAQIAVAGGKKRKDKKRNSSTNKPQQPTTPAADRPTLQGLSVVNDVKMVRAQTGETPLDVANRAAVDVSYILKYNEELSSPDQSLSAGTAVYLQPKRGAYRGRQQFHKVVDGERMYDIAQRYAIKLRKLYKRNRMEGGSQPAVGERVQLRGRRKTPPRLRAQQIPTDRPVLDMEEDTDEWQMETPEESLPEIESERPPVDTPPKPPVPNRPVPPVTPDSTRPTETTPKPAPPVISAEKSNANNAQYHTVQSGETLYRISRQYGVSVAQIMQWNQLSSATIRVGQRLKISMKN